MISLQRPRAAIAAILAAILAVLSMCSVAADAQPPARPYRILHVMSYHSPWRWTDGQLQGFQEAMAGVPAEYRVFQMDTKRHSTPEAKEAAGREARALIDEWKPDLVYLSDDDAQEYVTSRYRGTAIPFVFSGVNKAPATYGFEGAGNVTGVLEQEHFAQSVQLLRKLAPGVKRIAVVFDEAPMWEPVRKRMEAAAATLPEVAFGPWDTIATYADFKDRMRAYQDQVDAVALIGIFNFKDADGRDVPYQEVLRWVAEHSRLPDLGFWIDRVHHGTLCAVTVSEHEQGLAAGRLARAILTEGASPGSLPMRPTVRGLPVISLARARDLGLKPDTSLLLSAEVVPRYEWQQP